MGLEVRNVVDIFGKCFYDVMRLQKKAKVELTVSIM